MVVNLGSGCPRDRPFLERTVSGRRLTPISLDGSYDSSGLYDVSNPRGEEVLTVRGSRRGGSPHLLVLIASRPKIASAARCRPVAPVRRDRARCCPAILPRVLPTRLRLGYGTPRPLWQSSTSPYRFRTSRGILGSKLVETERFLLTIDSGAPRFRRGGSSGLDARFRGGLRSRVERLLAVPRRSDRVPDLRFRPEPFDPWPASSGESSGLGSRGNGATRSPGALRGGLGAEQAAELLPPSPRFRDHRRRRVSKSIPSPPRGEGR